MSVYWFGFNFTGNNKLEPLLLYLNNHVIIAA